MSLKTREFILNTLNLGRGTREDTIIILSYLYDAVKKNGINEIILGQYLYIKNYLDKHRELIKDKKYNIISVSSIIDRLNLINKEKQLNLEDKTKYVERVEQGKIKLVLPDIPVNKKNVEYIFDEEEAKKERRKNLEDEWKSKKGIYGIYAGNKLVYIGKTFQSFKERFNEHMSAFRHDDSYKYQKLRLYKEAGMEIQLRPIVILEDLQMEHKRTINNTELSCMELALIQAFKPELNVEGKIKPYVFR